MSAAPGLEKYPHVFQPIELGAVTVPNRIYFSPHGVGLDVPIKGLESYSGPSRNRIHYFAERARGGVGLIMHSTIVAPVGIQPFVSEIAALKENIPAYAAVADAVHEHGSKIMAEIWYVAWMPKRWEQLGPEAPALAPSASQNLYSPTVRRAMSKEEIRRMREAFADASRNLREAGYDGVQFHMFHGSVGEYFLSPYFNRRTDEYGGSLENRMRFVVETLELMREAMGPDLALSIRQTADQQLPGGMDEEQTKEYLQLLVATRLLDFVDLDISVEPEQNPLMTTGMFDPIMHNAERVGRVREAIQGIPVVATPGRVTNIAQCEKLIADGTTDMVGMVRGLIAEPAIPRKALEGREREARRCLAVNACVDPVGVGWGCAINATAFREERWGADATQQAARSMKVVVVGGGPAGMEAARIAAERGHGVTLLEREDELGGGAALWARLPGREVMASMAGFFADRLPAIGVDLRLGSEATVDDVVGLSPEVVVLASGSRYSRDGASGFSPRPLAGVDQDFVHGPEEIIRGDLKLSGKVVVIDDEGYHTGVGVAEMLAAGGAEVELVSRKETVGASLGLAIGYVAGRLRASGVVAHNSQAVTGIGDHSVTKLELMSQTPSTIEDVDHVVVATMREAVDELHEPLEAKVPYVYLVGDALAPRNLRAATYEGHRFGRVIGDDDMPASVAEELFSINRWHQVPAAPTPSAS